MSRLPKKHFLFVGLINFKLEKNERSVIILAGDIGYEVFLNLRDWQKIEKGGQQEFFIYSYIKQDSFDLYGFDSLLAMDFFKKLLLTDYHKYLIFYLC